MSLALHTKAQGLGPGWSGGVSVTPSVIAEHVFSPEVEVILPL